MATLLDGFASLSLFLKLGSICLLLLALTFIFFVIFGLATFIKLKRNPATRHKLGINLIFGFQIFNVAAALSRPRWLSDRIRRSSHASFSADEAPLYAHTNKLDRVLARILYFFWSSSVLCMFLLLLIDITGITS